ncbi:MAG: hypothetical protein KDJ99_25790 [Candidatus Competibacteraceae bacterium]|nr:hypothetical protein [Candidatus Competibacteraceae bacterium]
MKTFVKAAVALALTLVVAAGFSSAAFAQGKQPSYTSGIQFANLEGTQATINLIAYKSDGSQGGSGTYTVDPNGSRTLFPLADVQSGFSGSIVISSDKNGAAIANVLASDFSAGASYVGRSAGAQEVQLPLLNKGNSGFDTWFSVQNAGSASANVTVKYSDNTEATATIPAGAAQTFFQAQENHSASVFAGTVTSDQNVVAAVIQESDTVMFAYTAFTGGTTNPVFPLVNANNAGYISGLSIQNAGDTATSITVSYTPSAAGTACTETQTVQPGAAGIFALVAFNSNNSGATTTCTAGERFIGSAQVTANSANQPLVGIGNQLLPGRNGEAYGSFSTSDATAKVVMPLIMDRNSGYFTGFNIANVGTAAATVNCTFTNSSYTVSGSIPAGGALTDIQSNKIADKYVGAATCTATPNTSKIVAVVNQLGSNPAADQFLVYEAVNTQ